MDRIKRIIFDLDNTLILWKEEYTSALQKAMKDHNVKCDYKDIDAILESQEKLHEVLTKEQFLEDINNGCNLNLNIDFIDSILEYQKELVVENDTDLIETIKYLSSKYELVLLTNWFKDTQRGRLENAGILKYFEEVYGGDEGRIKPHKDSFKRAIGNHTKEECIMIGDSDYHDIQGALTFGIKVIKCDYKDEVKEKVGYPVIKNIRELMDLL